MAWLDLAEGILEEFSERGAWDTHRFVAEAMLRRRRSVINWGDWLANKPREWVLAVKREYARRRRANLTSEERAKRNEYRRQRAATKGWKAA